MINDIVRQKLIDVFNQDLLITSIEKQGGMTNSNYLVVTTDNKYIVKLFGKGTEKLINRYHEKENLKIIADLDIDVKNYIFDIEKGIKVNEFIEDAETLNAHTLKESIADIANLLAKVHCLDREFVNRWHVFEEIKKYQHLTLEHIHYNHYDQVNEQVWSLEERLLTLGLNNVTCHLDLVPENFLRKDSRLYLIDWEYAAMCDPMWDIAALFLESQFKQDDEQKFLSAYRLVSYINTEKILIFKILQDFLWSLWTIYKEMQGEDLGEYGNERYNRCILNLKLYGELYE